MALPTFYDAGVITLANGGTAVTGDGTAWVGKVFAGDLLFDPAQGIIAVIAADATSDTALTLEDGWSGTALADAAYKILFTADSVRGSERTRQLLEEMSVVRANGSGRFYKFSTTITDADPGSGYLRLNSATIASATAAYVDDLDANGGTFSGIMDTWDDSTSTVKGQLWLQGIANKATIHAFNVTGSVVDGTGYRKLTLEYVAGSGSLNADEELMVFFARTGDQGNSFTADAEAADLTARAAYDAEAEGFVVLLASDGGDPPRARFDKRVTAVAGTWETIGYLTGAQGADSSPRVAVTVWDPGRPGAGEEVWRGIFDVPVSFPADLISGDATSYAEAGVVPTADAVYSIKKNGAEFATLTFAAAATGGTFSAPATDFAAGDVLSITAPDPRDATLARIAITLAGTR